MLARTVRVRPYVTAGNPTQDSAARKGIVINHWGRFGGPSFLAIVQMKPIVRRYPSF